MADNNVTIKLQNVVNLASQHADLLPLAGVGGYSNEPALSLCNDVLEEALAAPTAWKFNRAEMGMFVTYPNRQDYLFAGAVAFTLGASSRGVGIGLKTSDVLTSAIVISGSQASVTCLQPHGFSVGAVVYMFGNSSSFLNSVFTQNENSTTYSGGFTITGITTVNQPNDTFLFTLAGHGGTLDGSAGIADFGWLESGTIVEVNSNGSIQTTRQVEAVHDLTPSWFVATPDKVCVLQDLGTGVLKIRFREVPGSTIWACNLVYQKQAPLKTALSDTWAPFPDQFSYVYRQGFLARCYRYIDSPKADNEDAKFQRAIAKAAGKDDVEASDQHVYPERSLMDNGYLGPWY